MAETRSCPQCAELILAEAIKCRWCGELLAPPTPPAKPVPALVDKDQEHLRLLTIFHYVYAALSALMACIPIIHVVLGLVFILSPESLSQGKDAPPAFFGWLFVIGGGLFILLGWAFAVCLFVAGRRLARRTGRVFCFVVAGLCCIHVPLGTLLGVFTIVVLQRPSVRALFERTPGTP